MLNECHHLHIPILSQVKGKLALIKPGANVIILKLLIYIYTVHILTDACACDGK